MTLCTLSYLLILSHELAFLDVIQHSLWRWPNQPHYVTSFQLEKCHVLQWKTMNTSTITCSTSIGIEYSTPRTISTIISDFREVATTMLMMMHHRQLLRIVRCATLYCCIDCAQGHELPATSLWSEKHDVSRSVHCNETAVVTAHRKDPNNICGGIANHISSTGEKWQRGKTVAIVVYCRKDDVGVLVKNSRMMYEEAERDHRTRICKCCYHMEFIIEQLVPTENHFLLGSHCFQSTRRRVSFQSLHSRLSLCNLK